MGDPNPGYIFAPVCQLDVPPGDAEKEPCRKKGMIAAYRRRLEFRGNECGPWKEIMGEVAMSCV